MDYFLIKYDDRIKKPECRFTEQEFLLTDTIVKETKFTEAFADFIAYEKFKKSYYIISEELRKVVNMYCPGLKTYGTVFTDNNLKIQKLYWRIHPETEDILSEQTEYFFNDEVKKIVLRQNIETVKDMFLLRCKHETFLACSLDIAESAMRRSLIGMKFVKIRRES